MNVPLLVAIELSDVDRDRSNFDFTITVPENRFQPFVGHVSVCDDDITPVQKIDLGFLDQMPEAARQRFVALMFRFCFSEMNEASGSAIDRSFTDVTKLLRMGLTLDDARVVLDYLIGAIDPGAVAFSRSVVRID